MITRQSIYITFKGIYIAETTAYFLCDFYRNPSDGSYTVVADTEGGEKTEIHCNKAAADSAWQHTPDRPVAPGLLLAIAEQLTLLEQGGPGEDAQDL